MKQIIVSKNEAGQRLDKLLAKVLNQAPKSFFYKMLRKKNIKLNDKKAEGSEKLVEGDVVTLYLSDETISSFSSEIKVPVVKSRVNILYEDTNLLIVNKEIGMLSQKAEKEDISLVEHIISYLVEQKCLTKEDLQSFKPGICNRLDRNTSGIVVAGKTLLGLQTMSELFHDRTIHKYYKTIVKGNISSKERVYGFLVKDEVKNKVRIIQDEKIVNNLLKDTTYQVSKIETEYKPLKSNGEYTLLEVKLITGKTHQIRAHLSSINHPIIGDYKYGDKETNRKFKEAFQLEAQLLHAYRIEFPKLSDEFLNVSEKQIIAKEPSIFQAIEKEIFNGR